MSAVGLILLLVPADAGMLAEAEAEFHAAVAARDDGPQARQHLQRAIARLEALQKEGARNAGLSLQLGNARLLADDLDGAILAYHQGLEVAPGDRALTAALEHARSLVAHTVGGTFGRPPADELPPWLPRPGPTTLLVLALLAFTLGCVAVTRQRMTRTVSWMTTAVVAFLVAGALTVLLAAQQQAAARRGPLVVIAEDGVLLRRGDSLAYPPRYSTTLPCGAEARLRRVRGDWLQVELAGGEIGWIHEKFARRE